MTIEVVKYTNKGKWGSYAQEQMQMRFISTRKANDVTKHKNIGKRG